MSRHTIFKHYWWLALLIGGLAAWFSYSFGGGDRVGLLGAVVAGTVGFCYFVQQQKLAETELFHRLFTQFNERYDKINEPLATIVSQSSSPSAKQLSLIVDYFNLCAEEYLFYKEGYIRREVWRSWCRGMLWYLRRHPFKEVWNEEVKTESFYGLTLAVIQEGAS